MSFSFSSPLSVLLSWAVILVGVYSSLMSVNMMGLWVGLELTFMGSVGVLGGFTMGESESLVKYFVVQVVGSCFILVFIMFMVSGLLMWFLDLFFMMGLLLKLGLFPFHVWVPGVASELSWMGCFLVLVVQKIVPFWMIFSGLVSLMSFSFGILELSSIMTGVVGCLGGLQILHFRVLLAYSSLIHLGMMVIISVSWGVAFFWYYCFYFVVNFFFMMSLWVMGIYSFFDVVKSKGSLSWVSLYLFSLSGIPPFLGSMMKLIFLISSSMISPFACVMLLGSSVVSLYFYMSVFLGLYYSVGGVVMGRSMSLGWVSFVSVIVNLVFGWMCFIMAGLW
uniref:NADH dehydrogenase subunit 2 n=1 Tax=Glauconome virens TaxID=457868 RepID=UPI00315CD5CF